MSNRRKLLSTVVYVKYLKKIILKYLFIIDILVKVVKKYRRDFEEAEGEIKKMKI